MPETNVTTAITAATPITTPSSVSTERSLLTHNDCSAIRMASATCINSAARCLARAPGSESSLSAQFRRLEQQWAEDDRPRQVGSRGYNGDVGSWTGRSLFASSDAGRGKSELRRAVCRITSGRPGSSPSDGKCHRKHTAWVFTDAGKGEKVR